jgi:translation initiation factor IF-3
MSFDKYRYELAKKEREERKAQKGGGLKQVQISAREAIHDLQRKARLAEKFFEEGHGVEVALWLRGR